MDKIVSVFRPWVDAVPHLDIVWSDKFNWVCIDTTDPEPFVKFAQDKTQLLTVIAEWFFDRASVHSWTGAADRARKDMAPYLELLPKEDRKIAETVLKLFAKLETVP